MQVAAIYARYSTDGQRETSIDDQVRRCREVAEKNGYTVDDALALVAGVEQLSEHPIGVAIVVLVLQEVPFQLQSPLPVPNSESVFDSSWEAVMSEAAASRPSK